VPPANTNIASFSTTKPKFHCAELEVGELLFEKFVYDPENIEGAWENRFKGKIYGSLSILAASMVSYAIDSNISLSKVFNLTLNTVQKLELYGGGNSKELNTKLYEDILPKIYDPSLSDELKKFYTSVPQYLKKSEYGLKEIDGKVSSKLLNDFSGYGKEFLNAKALKL